MRMRKFPLEHGREYLLLTKNDQDELQHVVGFWNGYGFSSIEDANEDDFLVGKTVLEYLPL